MRHCLTRLRGVLSILVVFAATGCGGGGGGGGKPDVTAHLDGPLSIKETYYSDGFFAGVYFNGHASGNLKELEGKILYISVEDPDGLLKKTSAVVDEVDENTLRVGFAGRDFESPAHYQGEFKVRVCFDSQCASEMHGSPLHVPYDVTVLQALSVQPAVTVNTAFGAPATTATVNVTLPEGVDDWSASVTTSSPIQLVSLQTTTAADRKSGTIVLTVLPANVGSRSEQIEIQSTANGGSKSFNKLLQVNTVVAENPAIDYLFIPNQLTAIRKASDTNFDIARYFSFTQPGTNLQFVGVDYLSAPPDAQGNPAATSWFYFSSFESAISNCRWDGGGQHCMPPGTYTARVHYKLSKGDVETDVYYPITLEIQP